jgi:Uma2 family endonuclease
MKVVSRTNFDEFCVLVKESQKADLIGGVIYMASPDNTDANDLMVWIGGLVDLFVETFDMGRVFASRVAFRLSDYESPEPDLAVVLKSRLHLVRRGFVKGRPDMALEIVSPDSIERDYVFKRLQYQEAKIPEYWIVDEIKRKVILLRLGRDGEYREQRPRKGALYSSVLPGLWMRPEWLWQKPRPKKTDILARILAS